MGGLSRCELSSSLKVLSACDRCNATREECPHHFGIFNGIAIASGNTDAASADIDVF